MSHESLRSGGLLHSPSRVWRLSSVNQAHGKSSYTLALRLRDEYQPNYWRDAAVIPVLRIRIAEGGAATYEPFHDILGEPVQ